MMGTSQKVQRPASQDVTSPAKPVASFRYGSVFVALFTNQVKAKDGRRRDVQSVSVRRSYRNADGGWENTHSLRPADLLPAAYALTKCYELVGQSKGTDDEERQ